MSGSVLSFIERNIQSPEKEVPINNFSTSIHLKSECTFVNILLISYSYNNNWRANGKLN